MDIQEDGYLKEKLHSRVDGQTVSKYSAKFFQTFNKLFDEFMQ